VIESAVERRAVARPKRTGVMRTLAHALRVRQWTKNLLLFAGLLFAAKLGDAGRWGEAWLAFAAYCAASSAAYLVNDVHDAERDRLHPVKQHRPVAAGRISAAAALVLAAVLAAGAFAAAAYLAPVFALLMVVFLGVQLAYSFAFKRVAGIDVLAIAGLFTIRAAAGAEAVRVYVSPWLLACAALLALFLGLAKRRSELVLGGSARPALAGYSAPALDRLLVVVAATTVGAYTAYAVAARDSLEMLLTVPFVAFALVRYLVLVFRSGLGEAPEEILLTDAPILIAIAAWAVTAAVLLTLS
jgi:4-hydroxybenzoate polyprenyltransferase